MNIIVERTLLKFSNKIMDLSIKKKKEDDKLEVLKLKHHIEGLKEAQGILAQTSIIFEESMSE